MFKKIKLILQLIKNMGTRYILYRVWHMVNTKSGRLKRIHPIDQLRLPNIDVVAFKKTQRVFEQPPFDFLLPEDERQKLKEKTNKILDGELLFFNESWTKLGQNFDWLTNPETGHKYSNTIHWSNIQDFNTSAGDIKFVWEKSRFSYLLTIMRFDFHFKEDHSEFIFNEIESWIDANPVNQGPNWKCSQEISLRIFNWVILLDSYKTSNHLTEERWVKIYNVIYWSLDHVYKHINFSRIAVRNNHAITETLFLSVSNILFPFISETIKYSKKGRIWFEKEIDYQVYDDGTFLQFSMNYHRVLIQLFTLGISITENAKHSFSNNVKLKAYKSLNFLYQCMDDTSGYLPNYGNNDGALFFPFSEQEYRDFRPQLNALHFLLTGKDIFSTSTIQEERNWLCKEIKIEATFAAIQKKQGVSQFINGGYFCIRNLDTLTFIRCGSHKDRPAHADNLHIDIWDGSNNILWDSGTYKYNTTQELTNYFTGALGHNTVMLNDESQMLKGSRFIWYYWSQSEKIEVTENENYYEFSGTISAFRQLDKKIKHQRTIRIKKAIKEWEITDEIIGGEKYSQKQLWHHNSDLLNISSSENSNEISPIETQGYYSSGYGIKEPKPACYFPFSNKITTTLKVK